MNQKTTINVGVHESMHVLNTAGSGPCGIARTP